MKICVFTLGCKVNRSESDSLTRALKEKGYIVTDELVFSDIFVVNTCAVTSEAEKKSRQTYARIKAVNPDAKIIFTGCASQKDPMSFYSKDNSVIVTGTFNKGKIIDIIDEKVKEKSGVFIADESKVFEELPIPEHVRTRSYIKIQDGCNNFCSYCIIPYLRGRSRSKKAEKIVDEIVKADALEYVLGGIDISSYNDGESDLKSLINMLRGTVSRIRIGSFEVRAISEGLLKELKNLKNFAPHFHLSLQSGSDKVLFDMNRHYTTSEYMEKVDLIRKYFDNPAITTDVIVGFPTEDEEEHIKSMEFIKKVGFSDIHPFPYSKRTGTKSAKLKDLDGNVKKNRLNDLLKIKKELKDKYLTENLGKTLTVLFETDEDGFTVGYSENYLRVYVKENSEIKNTFCSVKAVSLYRDGILGEVIKD